MQRWYGQKLSVLAKTVPKEKTVFLAKNLYIKIHPNMRSNHFILQKMFWYLGQIPTFYSCHFYQGTVCEGFLQSYNLTILQSKSPTILQYLNPNILWSYNVTMLQSYNPTISQYSKLFRLLKELPHLGTFWVLSFWECEVLWWSLDEW